MCRDVQRLTSSPCKGAAAFTLGHTPGDLLYFVLDGAKPGHHRAHAPCAPDLVGAASIRVQRPLRAGARVVLSQLQRGCVPSVIQSVRVWQSSVGESLGDEASTRHAP
mmetsp:Transcript_26851/g.85319  ORF Transcript_26851/g.85319 Transcript_26851/m.85319 type:complete len:108 (-) Transcript_26851:7-330(-)